MLAPTRAHAHTQTHTDTHRHTHTHTQTYIHIHIRTLQFRVPTEEEKKSKLCFPLTILNPRAKDKDDKARRASGPAGMASKSVQLLSNHRKFGAIWGESWDPFRSLEMRNGTEGIFVP